MGLRKCRGEERRESTASKGELDVTCDSCLKGSESSVDLRCISDCDTDSLAVSVPRERIKVLDFLLLYFVSYNESVGTARRASLSLQCGVMSEMVAAVLELKRCCTALRPVFVKQREVRKSSRASVSYCSNSYVHLIEIALLSGNREAYACTLDAG